MNHKGRALRLAVSLVTIVLAGVKPAEASEPTIYYAVCSDEWSYAECNATAQGHCDATYCEGGSACNWVANSCVSVGSSGTNICRDGECNYYDE